LGSYHSAAIDINDKLWIWGDNRYEQCDIPTELQGSGKIKQLSLGFYHSAAIDMNDKLWMWGYNNYGQITPTQDFIDATTKQIIQQDIKINNNTYEYKRIYEIDNNSNNIINDTINSI
jgi:alpha-tubulin suppressor-like RCC1 family protein